jgi:hypothetical protein
LKLDRFGWFEWSLTALTAVYLLQMLSPIRLDTDSVRYLMIAIGMADGTPVADIGAPSGYPALIALLIRIGLGKAPVIVLVNCLSMAAGLIAVWFLSTGFPEKVRRWTIILTLLSFPVLRTVVMPNTEPVYFGLSYVALATMRLAVVERGARRYAFIAGATVLTLCAVAVRIVGIALAPALIWTAIRVVSGRADDAELRKRLAATIGILAAIAAALVIAEHGVFARYFVESRAQMRIPLLDFIVREIVSISRGLGVISVNAPISRLIWPIPYLKLVGLVPAAILLYTARRAGWKGPVAYYFAAYMLIILAWPFFTQRLWMPIIPVILLHGGAGLAALRPGRMARRAIHLCMAWFILTGAACLAYMTRVSLSGVNFRARYGFAGGLASPGHEDTMHNTYVRIIVKRFDADNPAWQTLLADPASRPGMPR